MTDESAIEIIDLDSEEEMIAETAMEVINLDSEEETDDSVCMETNDHQYLWGDTSINKDVITSWKLCQQLDIKDADDNSYIVRYVGEPYITELPAYKLAFDKYPNQHVRSGTRVLAFRRSSHLPHTIECGTLTQLYASQDLEPYPGIVATSSKNRDKNECYMVFFDDGHVQKVGYKDIRLMVENRGIKEVHWNAKDYYHFFLADKNYSKLCVSLGEVVTIESNGNWVKARTEKLDADLPLAQFCFKPVEKEPMVRYEWLFLGSPRLQELCHKFVDKKLLKFFDEDDSEPGSDECVMIEQVLQSSLTQIENIDEITPVPEVLKYKAHECNHNCVRMEDDEEIEKHSLFHRPLVVGFKRRDGSLQRRPFYIAPCGVRLYTYVKIHDYLLKTDSKLRINSFTLDKNFDLCERHDLSESIVIKNIAHNKEKLPIPVCGSAMELEDNFNYITQNRFDAIKNLKFKNNLNRSCECNDNCHNKQKCSCWRLTIEKLLERTPSDEDFKQNNGVGYKNNMRLIKAIASGIVECGDDCKCCAGKCANRVVQRGLEVKLQVFKTTQTGWGVRTAVDLPPGLFICVYFAEIIDERTAEKRDYMYQFSLGEHVSEQSLRRVKRARIQTQDFLNFLPQNYFVRFIEEIKLESTDETSCEQITEFVADSKYYGNITRFINHSCDPNVFTQKVFVGNDERFPLIAFFTNRLIKAGTELKYNYLYKLDKRYKTKCLCGSSKCRGRLM